MKVSAIFSGLFGKKKDVISKEHPSGLEEVPLSEYFSWVERQLANSSSHQNLNQQLNLYLNKFKDSRHLLQERLEDLQQEASLTAHRDIARKVTEKLSKLIFLLEFPPHSTVHILIERNPLLLVEVNSQINMVQEFLEHVPKQPSAVSSSSFSSSSSHSFSPSSNSSNSSSMFSALEEILSELQELSRNLESLSESFNTSGAKILETLPPRLEKMKNLVDRKSKLKERISFLKERLRSAEEKKAEKESELLEMKENAEYKNISALKKKKKDLLAEVQEKEERITNFFNQLSPVLEEYRLSHPSPLIDSYLLKPLSAFKKDENLAIEAIIKDISSKLETGHFSLTVQELTALSELTANTPLLELHNSYFVLLQELEDIRHEVGDSPIFSKVEDAHYRQEHFSKQIDKLSDDLVALEEEYNELEENVKRGVQLFQNLAKISLNKEVKITL
jgi:hypothetical protein